MKFFECYTDTHRYICMHIHMYVKFFLSLSATHTHIQKIRVKARKRDGLHNCFCFDVTWGERTNLAQKLAGFSAILLSGEKKKQT